MALKTSEEEQERRCCPLSHLPAPSTPPPASAKLAATTVKPPFKGLGAGGGHTKPPAKRGCVALVTSRLRWQGGRRTGGRILLLPKHP